MAYDLFLCCCSSVPSAHLLEDCSNTPGRSTTLLPTLPNIRRAGCSFRKLVVKLENAQAPGDISGRVGRDGIRDRGRVGSRGTAGAMARLSLRSGGPGIGRTGMGQSLGHRHAAHVKPQMSTQIPALVTDAKRRSESIQFTLSCDDQVGRLLALLKHGSVGRRTNTSNRHGG